MDNWESRENVRKLILNLDQSELIDFARKLKIMNISSAAVFPGLDGFCRSLEEHLFSFPKPHRRGASRWPTRKPSDVIAHVLSLRGIVWPEGAPGRSTST